MAQEHPFGKCGKVQKSPFSHWSFSPLLPVCTKAIHVSAVSPLFPLLLSASKPFWLKKRKENSYLLVYWGCVLPIYHVCIYLWVKIVSLVLFEAGGECFKNMVWDICFFCCSFFSFPSLKTKRKKTTPRVCPDNFPLHWIFCFVSDGFTCSCLRFVGFFVFALCPFQQFEIISKAPDLKKEKKKSPVKNVYCYCCNLQGTAWPKSFCEHGRGCPALPLVLLCDSYGVGTRPFLVRFYHCYQMVAQLFFLRKWICHNEMS